MKLSHIKTSFTHIRIPKRGEYRTISSKAHHDWKMMVVGFILLSAVAIAGNFYLFWQISNSSFSADSSTVAPSQDTVSKKNLEDTVTFFKNRQARLLDLQTNKPSAPDPAL